ncbi:MAG: hypothetical protein ACFFER_12690, partial [Candidatus Thorarchaeota archaeon]
GGTFSDVVAINEQGQVIGSSTTDSGVAHAFIWTAEDGMVAIGTGSFPTEPVAINEQGQVVGNRTLLSLIWPITLYTHAFIWTAEDGMLDLGTLGGLSSDAVAINGQGQVIGSSITDSGETHAFVWTAEDGMVDLGTPGGTDSDVVAINEQGQVIGSTITDSGITYAFVWTAEDGMVDLGTLGGLSSEPVAINGQGQVVGKRTVFIPFPPAIYTHAFIWTAEDGMVDLGTLGGTDSDVVAINEQGQVIGSSTTDSGDTHAVLWTYNVVDVTPPTINHPEDVQYIQGAQGETITWTPFDYYPDSYTISQDGEIVESGLWSGGSILIEIDGLQPGTYFIECTVYDTSGNSASDTVQVEVISQTPIWVIAPTDQVISHGEQFEIQIAAVDNIGISEVGICDWWINDTVRFELSADYYGYASTARIESRAILDPGTYGLWVIVTDCEGNSLSAIFQVTVTRRLTLKLSGSFDYLEKEKIHLQLAALLTDMYTGEPITGATVTFDLYAPDGSLILSEVFDEDTEPGVYIFTALLTINDLKTILVKGIYLVYAQSVSLDGLNAIDMIQFHIDPPGETPDSSLLPKVSGSSSVVLAMGVAILGALVLRKWRHSKLHDDVDYTRSQRNGIGGDYD